MEVRVGVNDGESFAKLVSAYYNETESVVEYRVEGTAEFLTELVDTMKFADEDVSWANELVNGIVTKGTREMRTKALVDILVDIEANAAMDTYQALANNIADYEIDDIADRLRKLADAIDAA